MADDFRDRRASGDDDRPTFAWSGARRRPEPEPNARPEDAAAVPPPPPGIPGQQRMSSMRNAAPVVPSPETREAPARPEPMRPAARVEAITGGKGANPQAEVAKIRLHELLIEEL